LFRVIPGLKYAYYHRSRYYWFELVTYLKKFILSGVLVFAQPGSTAQLYIACIVSFYFFAVLARTMPFKNAKTDRSAVIAEANLFCASPARPPARPSSCSR